MSKLETHYSSRRGPAVSHDKSASEYVLAGLYSAAEAVVRLLEEAAVVDQEDGAETSPMLGSSIDGNRVLLQRILVSVFYDLALRQDRRARHPACPWTA